jgi:predicted DNA-binding transcriptional regulator AlpA
VLLRYPDLVKRGIVLSRMTLWRLINDHGFPPGQLVSPNARAWDEALVNAWLETRPIRRRNSHPTKSPDEASAAQ